jgi:hypothetical protein
MISRWMKMETRSENLGQDLKAWAADQLHVEPGTAPEKIRAAYLRQLQDKNGGPNLAAREALLILTGRTNAARPTLALEATEQKLHVEIDRFASRFFSMAIADRRAEWERLRSCGQGFVRVDCRLAALRPGLYIVVPRLEPNTEQSALVSMICELFTLQPVARAARRQTILADALRGGRGSRWIRAANLLRQNHKAIAALEPELIGRLADAEALAEEQQRLAAKMRKLARPPAASGSGSGSNLKWAWIMLVVVGILIRAATSTAPPNRIIRQTPAFQPASRPDLDEFLKNKKFRIVKNGDKMEIKVVPDEEPVLPDKKAAEPPKNKQDSP